MNEPRANNHLDEVIQRLVASEQRFCRLAELSGEVTWCCDADLKISYISPGVEAMLGVQVDECLGRPIDRIFQPIENEKFFKEMARELRNELKGGQKARNISHRDLLSIRHSQGGRLWIEFTLGVAVDPEGELSGFLGITRNVTEIKILRDDSTRYQRQVSLALQGTQEGLFEWDIDRGVFFYSERWKALLGYSHKDIGAEAEEWFSRVHPDDIEELRHAISDHLRERTARLDHRFRMKPRSEEWTWMRVRAMAEYDDEGKPVRMAGFLSESQGQGTATAATPAARVSSDPSYEMILDRSGDVFWILDADLTKARFVSAGHDRVFGQNRAVFRDDPRTFFNLIHPDDQAGIRTLLGRPGTSPGEFSYRILTPEQKVRWIRTRMQMHTPDEDGPPRVLIVHKDVTTERRTEVAIQFDRFALDHARDAAVWVRGDGSIFSASARASALLGYKLSELTSMNITQIDAESVRAGWGAIADRLRGGETLVWPTAVRHRDGSEIELRISGILMSEETDCFCLYLHEPEERKSVLSDVDGGIEALLAESPDYIVTFDREGRILYANRDFWGKSPGELVGTKIYDHIPHDYEGLGRQIVDRAVSSGTPDMQEITLFGDSYFSYRLLPMKREGKVESIMVIATDITEHRRTADALRKSEERFELAIHGAKDGLWDWELDSRQIYFSPRWKEMLGHADSEIGASPFEWFNRVHPDELEALKEEIDQHLAGKTDYFEHECRVMHRDGRYRWMLYRGLAVRNDQGAIYRMAGSQTDITDRKNAEAEMRHKEEQMRATARIDAISRLAGGVAHDYNNLLSVVMGYAWMLQRQEGIESPMSRDLDLIRLAGERSASLTRQLMAFSRIQVLHPKVRSVDGMIEHIRGQLPALLGGGINVRYEHETDHALVLVDPEQFEQAMISLALNARESMPNGGDLIISTALTELGGERGDGGDANWSFAVAPGEYVRISVEDNGTAREEQSLARIFEPFNPGKNRNRREGLGLASVYGFVKQSSGYIDVKSVPGRGTTFNIFLPLVRDGVEVLDLEMKLRTHDPEAFTIMVVEDDEMLRTLIDRILGGEGYNVLPARHGEEAMEICEMTAGPIHLLVTSLSLPGMDGVELATRVAEVRPDVQTLFISGESEDEYGTVKSLAEGTGYLQKPLAPHTLLYRVREMIERYLHMQELKSGGNGSASPAAESPASAASREAVPPVAGRAAVAREPAEAKADAPVAGAASPPADPPAGPKAKPAVSRVESAASLASAYAETIFEGVAESAGETGSAGAPAAGPAATPASAFAAIVPDPELPTPPDLRIMFNVLYLGRDNAPARRLYTERRKPFLEFCQRHAVNPAVRELSVRYDILSGDPDGAREALASMREQWPDRASEQFELFSLLCDRYPADRQARVERAELAVALGHIDIARSDLDAASANP